MRTKEPYKVKVDHINSLEDLEREKERIQMEIGLREEGIKNNYQNLVHLLSFRNLVGSLIEEVSTTTTVVGKLFSLGKGFLFKRKKKKKERHESHGLTPEEHPE